MSSRLRYETSIDDMLAFQEFHLAHSAAAKKQMWILRGVSLFLVLDAVFLFRYSHSAIPPYFFLFAAFVFSVLAPALIRGSIRRQINKLYGSGTLKAMLGPSAIDVTPEGLHTRNNLNEVKTLWQGIDHVASSATHTYIYNTPVSAYVIPHDKISEGNIEEFLQDIEHHRAFAARLPA